MILLLFFRIWFSDEDHSRQASLIVTRRNAPLIIVSDSS
jgi:hypothetical protein